MKSVEEWVQWARTAADLIPREGWIKDRTAAEWKCWKQEQLAKRQSLRRPVGGSDPAQRSSLRESKVPADVVEFVSWLEADLLIKRILADEYRYLAYQRKLDEDAKGGPVRPGFSFRKPRND